MRKLLQKILSPFFVWLAEKFSAAPEQLVVYKSLSKLYKAIVLENSARGIVLPINPSTDHFIVLSDQHKGSKNYDDDFRSNEGNYIAALQYYHGLGYHFINLGDGEELWKNTAEKVIAAYPLAFNAEANFQAENRYYRTFGNHDLQWKNQLDVTLILKNIFPLPLQVYEGLVLRTNGKDYPATDIFLTHGHQGDRMSDNNALSTWAIAHLWAPIQRLLRLNINTPANDFTLRNKHNKQMYEWSSRKKNLLLVTGHTHKPVFASGKYNPAISPVIRSDIKGATILPTYFNTGCCCYNDGDITGIEIADGYIRLIKWYRVNNDPQRKVLEEKSLSEIINDL